jgi:ankyrin repeat protein
LESEDCGLDCGGTVPGTRTILSDDNDYIRPSAVFSLVHFKLCGDRMFLFIDVVFNTPIMFLFVLFVCIIVHRIPDIYSTNVIWTSTHQSLTKDGHYDIIKYLIYECPTIDVHLLNNLGQNSLPLLLSSNAKESYFAIENLDVYVDLIKYVIDTCNIDIHANDNDDKSALSYACMNSQINIVKYLIEGCDIVNIDQPDICACNSLHDAVCGGHYEIVKYLINDGRIDINMLDHQGYNAFHYSMITHIHKGEMDELKIAQCLLDDGNVDLTITISDGENVWRRYRVSD